MTHPVGMTLTTVTYGKPLGAAGTEASIDATVTVDRPIVWAETGQTLYDFPDPLTSGDSNYLEFQVPPVDQEGFLDLNGDETTDWAYTLDATVRLGNRVFSVVRTFQVFEGQEFVDLDLVATDDVITPGVTAPGPSVLSLAGETGIVTLAELEAMIEPGLARTYPRKAIITGTGIDPTGVTMTDTEAVQAIIDGAVAARVPAHLPIGVHSFPADAQLTVPSGFVLEGDGPGSVLLTNHVDINDPQHFLVNADRATAGNEDIVLRDFAIHGISPGGPTGVPSSPGVTLLMQRVRRLTVEGLTVKNTFGPAIYLDGVQVGKAVGNVILDCGRGGVIAMSRPDGWGLEDILINGNIIWGVGDDGLAVSSLTTGAPLCKNVVVTGNLVNGVYLEAYNEDDPEDGGRGFLGIGVDGLTLAGNYFGETASRGVLIKAQRDDGTRSRHITMGGNTCVRNGPIDSVQSSQGVLIKETDHIDLGNLTVASAGASGVTLQGVEDVKGNVSVSDCGELLAHFGLNVIDSGHVDVKLTATGNAGPGWHVEDQTGPVRVSGEWWDNCAAGAGTGNTASGVLLDTAGEVTVDGSSLDYRVTPKQSYGLAVINQAPSLLRINGGRYDLNPLGALRFATAPTRLIMRDVVQSLSDPTLNYDVGLSGIREYSLAATPAFVAPIGSRAKVADGSTYVNLTGLSTGWVPVMVGFVPVDKVKSGDQNTTGLAFTNVTDFSWTLVAQGDYILTGLIDYTAPLTGDISFQWTFPVGLTGSWNGDGVAANATSGSASVLRNRQTQTGVSSPGGIGTGHLTARPLGRFKNGNNAGTLQLQFAQASAVSGGDVGVESTVYAGSFLSLRRIA